MSKELKNIIISGGGTGGHIFPAISIADEIKRRYPSCKILFVGAKGRMEEEKVPNAGYEILLLPIMGLQRKKVWKNIKVFYRLLKSLRMVRGAIKETKPQAVIGVGGYASAPTLIAAQRLGITTLVQEQNSYAGVTNKIVGKKAKAVFVAYDNMKRFFPKAPIHFTGNPIRASLTNQLPAKEVCAKAFGLSPDKPTLLIIGGSLGALSVNQGVIAKIDMLAKRTDIQVLWQTGASYFKKVEAALKAHGSPSNIVARKFIYEMEKAYALATVVISRAGASSISEISALGLASILVPSPNVAEDHQTHNAMALVQKNAALMVKDADCSTSLIPTALSLLDDPEKSRTLSENVCPLGRVNAAEQIVDILEKILRG
ncbi:UDP-diphospho-muramoylpentapeptide beta-N-acetylglucosaminyltransferase [Porphyromonas canoris]|uniref:undecaprenyldiphospho-muramoylpentapeptide beta-N-acetylglucosaminyltransferase n=1 Tax=Porphyromonas canoris TaxID=36875 RepID=UPI00051CF5CA|nr:undecaprenyldiphospho-muramoylpentapeptide beta-N-acetylglucosaminyltransferase [Porphyromonas canoris]KGL51919.1 UDP-diphospho-muramoylpentapeptide beta-N-acetylglucosaminyltransferase [Porphyromonas canoris]